MCPAHRLRLSTFAAVAEQLKAKQEQAFEEQKQQMATAVLKRHLEARVAAQDAKRGRAPSTAWKAVPGAAAQLPRNVTRQRTHNAAIGIKFMKKVQGAKLASSSRRLNQRPELAARDLESQAADEQPNAHGELASLATTLPGMVDRLMATVETWSPRSQTESLHRLEEDGEANCLRRFRSGCMPASMMFHALCQLCKGLLVA